MSLQTSIDAWQLDYDNSGITGDGGNSNYLGSIFDTSGNYHTEGGIYNLSPALGLEYEIFDFNWYAGQGVNDVSEFGSKYLIYSECGFSWDTRASGSLFNFETDGSLDYLALGYTPSTDHATSPAQATLTTFSTTDPLLVVSNFDVAVDWVADHVFGSGTLDGNSQISASALTAYGLLSNAAYYD